MKQLARYYTISGCVKREYSLWVLERIGLHSWYLINVVKYLSEFRFWLEILCVCDFGVLFLNSLFLFLAHHRKLKVVAWAGLVSGELNQGIVKANYEEVPGSFFQRRVSEDLINTFLAACPKFFQFFSVVLVHLNFDIDSSLSLFWPQLNYRVNLRCYNKL